MLRQMTTLSLKCHCYPKTPDIVTDSADISVTDIYSRLDSLLERLSLSL
jgi:hypothetical protein